MMVVWVKRIFFGRFKKTLIDRLMVTAAEQGLGTSRVLNSVSIPDAQV